MSTSQALSFSLPLPSSYDPFFIRFYHPAIKASDGNHGSLNDILALQHLTLERDHTYIQTLFPLPEPSPVCPAAPLIDYQTFTAFRTEPLLRRQLRRSFHRMLTFYGLKVSISPAPNAEKSSRSSDNNTTAAPKGEKLLYTIIPCPHLFPTHSRLWFCRFSHNHLRITRIIRSLRILGCQAEAEAFFRAVRDAARHQPGRVSDTSVDFWTRAARRKLSVPPDKEIDDTEEGKEGGEVWLRGLGDTVGSELEGRAILAKLVDVGIGRCETEAVIRGYGWDRRI